MGGFVAIHAAATSDAIAGVIAICPAGEEHLLRGLRQESLEFRAGERARADLEAWLGEHDLRDAIELAGAKPTILIHAAGDERIPSDFSEELAAQRRRAVQADHRPRRPPPLGPARRRAAGHRPALARAEACPSLS